jgi:hypothetical protein
VPLNTIDIRGIKGGVEIVHGDVNDPDTIEINKKMSKGTFFRVGLEECAVPVYTVKLHEPLCWRKIDEAGLVIENDSCDAFWIPEELIDIIISNNILMIPFPSHKLAINDFVTLITNEPVERFDDSSKIQAFRDRLHTVLTLRGPVVIICTLEDEAEALWTKAHLGGLSPAKEIECNLP